MYQKRLILTTMSEPYEQVLESYQHHPLIQDTVRKDDKVSDFSIIDQKTQLLLERSAFQQRLSRVRSDAEQLLGEVADSADVERIRSGLTRIIEQITGIQAVELGHTIHTADLLVHTSNITLELRQLIAELERALEYRVDKLEEQHLDITTLALNAIKRLDAMEADSAIMFAKNVMGELAHLLQKYMVSMTAGKLSNEPFDEFMSRPLTKEEDERWNTVLAEVDDAEWLAFVCKAFAEERGNHAHGGKVDTTIEQYRTGFLELAVDHSSHKWVSKETGSRLLSLVGKVLGDNPFTAFRQRFGDGYQRPAGRRYKLS